MAQTVAGGRDGRFKLADLDHGGVVALLLWDDGVRRGSAFIADEPGTTGGGSQNAIAYDQVNRTKLVQ